MSPEEVAKIVAGMADPSGIQAGGIYIGGEKWMFIRSDDRLVAGKKARATHTHSAMQKGGTRETKSRKRFAASIQKHPLYLNV